MRRGPCRLPPHTVKIEEKMQLLHSLLRFTHNRRPGSSSHLLILKTRFGDDSNVFRRTPISSGNCSESFALRLPPLLGPTSTVVGRRSSCVLVSGCTRCERFLRPVKHALNHKNSRSSCDAARNNLMRALTAFIRIFDLRSRAEIF